MDFGTELDDDLFEISRNKKTEATASYTPKVYNSEWYLQPAYSEMEEHLTQLKSYADYLYYHHKYADCVQKYLECLGILQSSNITVRRDCLEGIARSLLHQEYLSEALVYALQLLNVACNIDHKVVAWNLLASIYHQMGRYADELDALHCCLQHHSWNYDFWLRLAFCYSGFFGIELNTEIQYKLLNTCGSTDKERKSLCKTSKIVPDPKTDEVSSNCDINGEHETSSYSLSNKESEKQPDLNDSSHLENNSNGCQRNVTEINYNDKPSYEQHCSCSSTDLLCIRCGTLIVCACLVRARLLLQTCTLGYRSFAQDSNVWQQEQVYLRDIGIEMIDSVEDKTVLDKLKEKPIAEEDEQGTDNVARKQFEARWFGWLLTT